MEYNKAIKLKDGRTCILRNGTVQDARAVLDNFILTHAQTDFLTSYPNEVSFTLEQEEEYLRKKSESADEVEILAEVDGRVAGTAGVDRIGAYEKVKHRAGFGISIDREFWGLGIGRALTEACIACAGVMGYAQLELEVVAENKRAVSLYRSEGFVEYGRNPKGFRSRSSGWQELLLMRRELDEDTEKNRTEGKT